MPPNLDISKVFVAMPFHKTFGEVYENAVCPAIIDAGLTPFRVDELIGHRNIIDDIEQGISEALLVFADLTTQNPNVFYEVGFARAMGKPLVVVTQDEDHVPFDLRQRRFITYRATEDGLREFKQKLANWFRQSALMAKEATKAPRVHCHGTKFEVPNRNEFWNNLLGQAQRRFYLLGRSNKSWINKSDRQRNELAQAIVRILKNQGTIKILSDRREEIVKAHKRFFNEYVLRLLDEERSLSKESLRTSLKYVLYEQSNYGAIVSDDRLVLLPTLNSADFRDETLVLEIFGSTLPQFSNYLSDIDRLIRERSEDVDILG